jgi:hypothetical protein
MIGTAAAPPVSDRWIQAQSVALGCSIVHALGSGADEWQKRVFGLLWHELIEPAPELQGGYLRKLGLLPPATLQALCDFPSKRLRWGEHRRFWLAAQAYQRTARKKGGRSTPIAGARILAERLLHGEFTPPQLIRLAKLELGVTWPDQAERPLADLIDSLKRDECLAGLADFRDRGLSLGRWELIENDLTQREFAWPLLILQSDSFEPISCALPIRVNVVLGAPADMPDVSFRFEGDLDCRGWMRPAVRALKAAIALWEHEHSTWDRAFAHDIRTAKVELDLRTAEKILEPYSDFVSVDLLDESLGAYLGLAILGQFIGHKGVDTVCATGKLGAFRRDDRGGDYRIDRVAIGPKIAGAEAAAFYEQIIVPGGGGDVATVYRPQLRVNQGEMFSHYAEHAMSQAWRKHRYVRAPDLAVAFKRYRVARDRRVETPSEQDQKQIDRVLEQLETSKEAILHVDADIAPANVMAALYEISRRASGDAQFAMPANEKLPAFATVRATESEGSERFWRVVWEMLDWSDADLKTFNFKVNGSAAAQMLARQMNRFVPTRQDPVRAPDLLVIVGYEHFPAPSVLTEGPFSRLHLIRLAAALKKLSVDRALRPTQNAAVRRRIGATRILLVPDPREAAPSPTQAMDPDLYEAAQKLAIFRHGFTREMARRIVDFPDDDFRVLFDRLLALRDDGRPVLVEAAAASEFFLAIKPAIGLHGEALAERHYDAANAIVGFLDPRRHGHRLDLSVGLSARWVHEAQWHLDEGRKLAGIRGGRYVAALERVNRIAEPFSWARIRRATRARSNEEGLDTWETLCAHLDGLPDNALVHPIELLWAAKFTYKLEGTDGAPPGMPERRLALLERALAACALLASEEGRACRFAVESTWATMIMQADPTLRGYRKAEAHTQAAIVHMSSSPTPPPILEILDPEWIECRGDAAPNARLAAPLYRLGFGNPCIRGAHGLSLSALVKYVATCAETETPLAAEVEDMIDKVDPRGRKWLADNPLPGPKTGGLHAEQHVIDRWDRGRRLLGRRWKATHAR